MQQTWREWKRVNQDKIAHIAGFEEQFVDSVLSQIRGITPEQVISQYPFKDHNGKNRYIDFVIRIPMGTNEKLLPIELDGKTKFDTYTSFNDTLERQNDLIAQFGLLLRYSNKKMLNQPNEIVQEISLLIDQIRQQRDTTTLLQQNLQNYQQAIQAELQGLKAELNQLRKQSGEYQHLQQLIQQMQRSQETLAKNLAKQTANQEQITTPSRSFSAKTGIWGLVSVIIIGLLMGGYVMMRTPTSNTVVKADYCGVVAQVYPFQQGVFLNFEQPYPNQAFSAVVYNAEIKQIGSEFLKGLEFKPICLTGEIQERNGKGQIQIKSKAQIQEQSR